MLRPVSSPANLDLPTQVKELNTENQELRRQNARYREELSARDRRIVALEDASAQSYWCVFLGRGSYVVAIWECR